MSAFIHGSFAGLIVSILSYLIYDNYGPFGSQYTLSIEDQLSELDAKYGKED